MDEIRAIISGFFWTAYILENRLSKKITNAPVHETDERNGDALTRRGYWIRISAVADGTLIFIRDQSRTQPSGNSRGGLLFLEHAQ